MWRWLKKRRKWEFARLRWPRPGLEPRDYVLIAALVSVTAGVAMIYVPAAFIVPGVVLGGMALWPMVSAPRTGS